MNVYSFGSYIMGESILSMLYCLLLLLACFIISPLFIFWAFEPMKLAPLVAFPLAEILLAKSSPEFDSELTCFCYSCGSPAPRC